MKGAEELSELPSPSDFVWTQTFEVAADRLEFAIRSKSPVILMLGQPGTGKTSLIQEILDNRLADFSVAYVGDPTILDAELSQTIRGALSEMRRTAPDDGGQAPVFIIDDAHKMLQTTLARLVEYTNQKSSDGPLLKLVLVAHPDFEPIFRRLLPGIAGPAFPLLPLSNDEAADFVRGKLASSGLASDFLKEDEIERLVSRSKGYPARLARSVEAALKRKSAKESAFGLDAAIKHRLEEAQAVPAETYDVPDYETPRETSEERVPPAPARKRRRARLLIAFLYVAALVAVAVLLYRALGASERLPFLPFGAGEVSAPPDLQVDAALPDAPNDLYRKAIAVGGNAPESAVVSFSLAALQGHERSAYFVGQMYEAGEGVTANVALAALWYASAADTVARAGERLDELADLASDAPAEDQASPELFHAVMRDTGHLHLMWNDNGAGWGQSYAIEFVGADEDVVETLSSDVPATLVRPHPRATRFRIVAAGEIERATGWFALPE